MRPDTKTFRVKTEVTVTFEQIANLLGSAFDPSVASTAYWADIKGYIEPKVRTYVGDTDWDKNYYKYMYHPLNEGGGIVVEDIEDPDNGPWTLDFRAIQRGLQLMAEKHPRHFSDLINENDDAETADVFVQLCLFGEVVYG